VGVALVAAGASAVAAGALVPLPLLVAFRMRQQLLLARLVAQALEPAAVAWLELQAPEPPVGQRPVAVLVPAVELVRALVPVRRPAAAVARCL